MEARTARTNTNPSIAYESIGEGDPVILVHGVGADRRTWAAQLPALAGSGRRAIAIDLRGYFESEAVSSPIAMKDFVDDIVVVLETIEARSAHLVGQSMGGMVIQHLLALMPQRVRSMTLVNTTRSLGAAMTEDQVEAFLETRRAPLRAGRSMASMAEALSDAVLGPAASADVRRRVCEGFAALRPENYIAALEMVTRYRPIEAPAPQVAVLVVSATHDRLTPPAAGRELAAHFPNAHYFELGDAGHMSHMEQSQAFNAALLDFLDRVSMPFEGSGENLGTG